MAKKKAKRKKRSASPKPRRKSIFVGDQILAIYQTFGCCCWTVVLGLTSSIGLGLAFSDRVKESINKQVTNKDLVKAVNNLSQPIGIALAVSGVLLLLFGFFFVRATWQGRRWAFWLHLILSLPGAIAFATLQGADNRFVSILPLIISVYAVLRLAGSVGPKM